jgi:hypothetical protein
MESSRGTKVVRTRINFEVGWAEADQAVRTVEIGDHTVPELIFVTFPGVDGQPKLEMTIDSSSGVPECAHVAFSKVAGGRGVRTSTDLRQADLETWIEAIVPLFMNEIVDRQITDDGHIQTKIVQRVPDSDAAYTKAAKVVVQKTRRAARRKMTPELLQRVANTYRSDEARPAHAVEKAFMVTARTAYRYIEEARKQGFLEATGNKAKNGPTKTRKKPQQ